MKTIQKIIFFICVILPVCLPVSAEFEDVIVSLQIDNPVMTVNGVATEVDEGRRTTPAIIGDRTLVPIRAIIEAFGGDVQWNGAKSEVVLTMDGDIIRLVINNPTARFNGKSYTLDTAPCIINERTMLPIRFIAESFNLAVAWNGESKTVYVVRNGFDREEYERLSSLVPEYSGSPYAVINRNQPFFEDYEIIDASFEYYSNLDDLGRCDVCMASIDDDLMPTEKRGDISSVRPTGWVNKKYDNVDGGYLYNRCHLIGFQLTGENANKRNLITGTRYMNVDGMLDFENELANYLKSTDNRVMYRVTPVFEGDNLVASGVLLEGYSVEDGGKGVSFCVYCYNVQPGIEIDYATGNNNSEN